MIQKVSDFPLAVCPDCGGKTEKKLSRTSFQLKGSGWYADGYSSKASSKEGETKSDTSSKKEAPVKSDVSKGESPKADKPAKSPKSE